MPTENHRIATIGLVDLTASNLLPDANYHGAKFRKLRVLADSDNSNTTDLPSIPTYLDRELLQGRRILFKDAFHLITGDPDYSQEGINSSKSFGAANTSESLVTDPTPCRGVMVTPHPSNTGRIWMGIGVAAVGVGVWIDASSGPIVVPTNDAVLVFAMAEVASDKLCLLIRN